MSNVITVEHVCVWLAIFIRRLKVIYASHQAYAFILEFSTVANTYDTEDHYIFFMLIKAHCYHKIGWSPVSDRSRGIFCFRLLTPPGPLTHNLKTFQIWLCIRWGIHIPSSFYVVAFKLESEFFQAWRGFKYWPPYYVHGFLPHYLLTKCGKVLSDVYAMSRRFKTRFEAASRCQSSDLGGIGP